MIYNDLQQLDNALLPLKADLLNSCVTYANWHIEASRLWRILAWIMISGAEARRAGPGALRVGQPPWPGD